LRIRWRRRKPRAPAQPSSIIVVARPAEQTIERSAWPHRDDTGFVVIVAVARPHAFHGRAHLLASRLFRLTALGEFFAALLTTLRAFLTPLLAPVAGLLAARRL
jgi:hypothetical protein